MKIFLFICTRHRKFGIFNFYALSATPYCLARYIILEKDDFSWNISSWCMPQLERFLNIWNIFYSFVQDIESSVSSSFMRYLRLPTALQGTLFWKKMIFLKYFKLVHVPTWKIPFYMKFVLFICTRHRKFGIFNFYALSATPYCFAMDHYFGKRWFSWNISSWCMPQLERFLFIWNLFYSFVQDIESSVSSTIFLYLRLSYALYGTIL